jgi:dsRNA-specific ribonuclease
LNRALTREALAKENRDINVDCKSQNTFSTLGDGLLRAILVGRLISQGETSSGEISKRKATLEKNKTLSKIANSWNLLTYIKMNKSEKDKITGKNLEGEKAKNRMLATTFEAIIGAIYLDVGYEETNRVVNKWYDKFNTPKYG